MEGRVNYTVVGVFIVMLTALLLITVFWLTTVGNQKQYNTYLLYVREDVTGLSVDGPVRFNGVKVGYVKKIALDPHNPRLVRLTLQIENKTPVTTTTSATLNAQGITGVVYVNLKASTVNAPLLRAKPGEDFPVIPAKPSLLMQLSAVLPELTKDIQQLSRSISQVMNEKNRTNLADTLTNVSKFTKTLANNSDNLSQSMGSLKTTLAHIAQSTKRMPSMMKNLDATLVAVKSMSTSVKDTSNTVQKTLRTSSAAVQAFSTQVLPNAEQMMESLHSTTNNINLLMQQLRHNPSMFLRGKSPAPLGPGEH